MDEHSSSAPPHTLHIVTSEPTIHNLFKDVRESPQVCDNGDSDQHYDFDLESPEGGGGTTRTASRSYNHQPLTNKKITKWSESSDRPESGCVTSGTSPALSRGEELQSLDVCNVQEGADLKAVSDKLSFSSAVVDSEHKSYCHYSAFDSGLYTEADFNADLTDSYVKYFINNNHEDERIRRKKIEDLPPLRDNERRRSFDFDVKKYLVYRLSSPPGYRPQFLCGTENEYKELNIPGDHEEIFKKRDSEVIYNGATRVAVKTKLFTNGHVEYQEINEVFAGDGGHNRWAGGGEAWRNHIKTLASDERSVWHLHQNGDKPVRVRHCPSIAPV